MFGCGCRGVARRYLRVGGVMRNLSSCFFTLIFVCRLLSSSPALSAELADPIIIPPMPGASPPQPAPGCPPVPAFSADVTVTSIKIRRGDRDIGPFAVPLDGYVTSSDPTPSYRPFLLKANPGGSLVMDFVVDPSVGAVVSNLHTHGLIVRPRPVQVPHASAPCPAGDYIFIRTGPAETLSAGGGDPAHQAYRVDIPKTVPAALLGRSASAKPEAPAPYPAGLYWIHAHLHGVARPQVTEGMSGLISIGDEKESIAPLPQSVQDKTYVRYLALRDIKLLMACPKETDGNGNTVLQCADSPPDLDTLAQHTPAEDAGELYSSIACDDSTKGNGWCAGKLQIPNSKPAASAYAYWLFTVTGQRDPTITIPQGKNHLWRVANLSANVSYLLELCDAASTPSGCDKNVGRHRMAVVSVDGVQAGSRGEAGADTSLGVEVNQLLMMPGSRAAILLRNDDEPNVPAGKLQLRNASFDTGPGPVIAGANGETGDTWPGMVLAEVDVQGTPPSATSNGRLLARMATRASIPRIMQSSPTSSGRDAASRPDCSFLPKDDANHAYRRQIIFDEDNANSIFRLGSQRVDQHNVLVADDRNIAPAAFQHASMAYTGDDFPPGLHACATLHRGEVWELINTTDELHNFHIHQGKFRLARKGDPGMPDSVTETFQDPSHLLDGIVAEGTTPNPNVDMWHDTFPVPPKKGNVNGRVFIFIPFEADEQVGRFVFHCHILEHEDNGMMAAMEVVREEPDKDEVSNANALPAMPMPKHH
jgi:FtsP/CotA-like multicopper oxidase with cupredoxin domain